MTGVLAARTLHDAGIDDFLIIEARDELGGRLKSTKLDSGLTIELGANWIEGISSGQYYSHLGVRILAYTCSNLELTNAVLLDTGKKLTNPIYELAKKHGLDTANNNWEDLTFYDENGVNADEFPKAYVQSLFEAQ